MTHNFCAARIKPALVISQLREDTGFRSQGGMNRLGRETSRAFPRERTHERQRPFLGRPRPPRPARRAGPADDRWTWIFFKSSQRDACVSGASGADRAGPSRGPDRRDGASQGRGLGVVRQGGVVTGAALDHPIAPARGDAVRASSRAGAFGREPCDFGGKTPQFARVYRLSMRFSHAVSTAAHGVFHCFFAPANYLGGDLNEGRPPVASGSRIPMIRKSQTLDPVAAQARSYRSALWLDLRGRAVTETGFGPMPSLRGALKALRPARAR